MAGVTVQPCFYRGNSMEVSEGRSQRLQQCSVLCGYRTNVLLHSPWVLCPWGGISLCREAEQEAGI